MTASNEEFSSDLVAPEQPFDQIVTAYVEDARVVGLVVEGLGQDAVSAEAFEREKPIEEEGPVEEGPPAKIHPVLGTWLEERAPDDRELILVNLRDNLAVPRFPEPIMGEARDLRPIARH